MTKKELVEEIRKLNPSAQIILNQIDEISCSIYSSKKPGNLKLPKGFYYNDKNGITNKHKTESGLYICLYVNPIKDLSENYIYAFNKPMEIKEVNNIEPPKNPIDPFEKEVNKIELSDNIIDPFEKTSNLQVYKVPKKHVLCKIKSFINESIILPIVARKETRKEEKKEKKLERKIKLEILKQKRIEILKLQSEQRIKNFVEKLDNRLEKQKIKLEKINNFKR